MGLRGDNSKQRAGFIHLPASATPAAAETSDGDGDIDGDNDVARNCRHRCTARLPTDQPECLARVVDKGSALPNI